MNVKYFVGAFGAAVVAGGLLSSCTDEGTCGPIPTSPIYVVLYCEEDALAAPDELGSTELVVELQREDGSWERCQLENLAASDELEGKHLCSFENQFVSTSFLCPGEAFPAHVRAYQGHRSAEFELDWYSKLSCIGPPTVILGLRPTE